MANDITFLLRGSFWECEIVNVVYFPQIGFLVALSIEAQTVDLPGFELQFVTENGAYFKNNHVRELDEQIGDIHGLIVDREIDLVFELQQNMIEALDLLSDISFILGELDWYGDSFK